MTKGLVTSGGIDVKNGNDRLRKGNRLLRLTNHCNHHRVEDTGLTDRTKEVFCLLTVGRLSSPVQQLSYKWYNLYSSFRAQHFFHLTNQIIARSMGGVTDGIDLLREP